MGSNGTLYGPGTFSGTGNIWEIIATLSAQIQQSLEGGLADGVVTNAKVAAAAGIDQTKIAGLVAALAALVPLAQKGAANGVATLGADSKVPSAQLPALAINETFTAVSQAAMLALTAQRGDMALRTDLTPNQVFVLATDDPTQLVNWVQIVGLGAVASVNGRTGTVSGLAEATGPFAPSITGATAASRYVGGTITGSPVAGTFAVGDYIIDQTGKVWVCTTAGTPGTWAQTGGADSTKVPLVQTQTAGTPLDVYKVQPSNAARGPFNFTVFDDGAGNHAAYWGYNAAPSGGKFKSTEHAFKWVHESAYGTWSESYTEYLSPDGTVSFRPWFLVIDKTTNVVQTHEFVGAPFTFKTIAGDTLLNITPTGVLQGNGAPGTDPTWQIRADAGHSTALGFYAAGVNNLLLTSIDANLAILRMAPRNAVQFYASTNVSGVGLGEHPGFSSGVLSVFMDQMISAAADGGKYWAAIATKGCAVPRQSNDHWRWTASDDSILGRVNKDGYFITKKNAAIPDADLTAGEMALWFDSTNGAAKLMVKAKQADGTVRTAAVALA